MRLGLCTHCNETRELHVKSGTCGRCYQRLRAKLPGAQLRRREAAQRWYAKNNGRERGLMASRRYKANNPFWGIWMGIRRRLNDPRTPCYPHYGGRGITMHPDWQLSYRAFESWIVENIGPRPSLKHSLDRINPDGHYAPGNLRWADHKTQRYNTREAVALRTMPTILDRIAKLEAVVDDAIRSFAA